MRTAPADDFYYNAQIMKFSIKDFFSKCDQICSFLRIWSHLLKKSLMEYFIFYAVLEVKTPEKVYNYTITKYVLWLMMTYVKCTVLTVNLCYLQVLALHKKV